MSNKLLTSLVVIVALLPVSWSALADDGGSSSGGTTFSKDTQKTLDSSTFETPFNPSEEFRRLLNERTYPAIENIRKRFPVLADELRGVFSKRIWWKTAQSLSGRPADSKIATQQQLVIDQDNASVLVSSAFWKKSATEQNTAFIHEGVRYAAIEKKLNLDDRQIQLITRMLEHADKFRDDSVLKATLGQAGLGIYLTKTEIEQIEKVQSDFVSFCRDVREAVRMNFLKDAIKASLIARSLQFTNKASPSQRPLELRRGIFSVMSSVLSNLTELPEKLNRVSSGCVGSSLHTDRGNNTYVYDCPKLEGFHALREINQACKVAEKNQEDIKAYDEAHSVLDASIILGTVEQNLEPKQPRISDPRSSDTEKKTNIESPALPRGEEPKAPAKVLPATPSAGDSKTAVKAQGAAP